MTRDQARDIVKSSIRGGGTPACQAAPNEEAWGGISRGCATSQLRLQCRHLKILVGFRWHEPLITRAHGGNLRPLTWSSWLRLINRCSTGDDFRVGGLLLCPMAALPYDKYGLPLGTHGLNGLDDDGLRRAGTCA